MIHQQRTPLQRFLSNIKLALLVSCLLAVPVFARPLTSETIADTLLQLSSSSSNNALAPKSTENKREIENEAAAPGPLSPEHERARQLWNKAKKLHHQLKPRRYVRNVNYVRRSAQVENHNVSKYILELYKNMTEQNNTGSQGTQANTVRSLQTINNDNTLCDVFNFSLSSINRSEYIVDAELRFSLVLSDKTLSNSNVYVTIHSLNSSDSSSSEIQSNIEITAEDNPQRIHVFKVAGKILPWVQEGARYAEFKVQFFSNYKATKGPLSCDKIHFYNGNNDEDTEPLLVVHSYDSDLDKIDYARILDTVKQNNTAAAEVNKRSVRETQQEIPFCKVLPLEVQRHEIPRKDGDEEIIQPESYNAGICGGDCGTTMPQNPDLGHNVLIHMLQGSSEFRDRHGHTITRCCAPTKYFPLKMLVVPPGATSESASTYIRILENMMVAQCECIEIVDFSNVTKRK